MRDGQPVAMNLEIGRFAMLWLSNRKTILADKKTHYAGNKRTFNAAATSAHCPTEGN